MIVRVDGTVHVGRAVNLETSIPPTTVSDAVRTDTATADGTTVEVSARTPGLLHDHVGCIGSDQSIRPRTALATAARSRGWRTPVDPHLAVARQRLAAVAVGDDGNDLAERRRAVANATDGTERLRERVAEARGRREAVGETGDASPDADEGVESVVRELSEVETVAAAAREAHERARAVTRETRDRLEARLRLADEVDNLRRAARAWLVERAEPAYNDALVAVPGVDDPVDPFDAAPDEMALAVARVGALSAPVVLATDRFPDARAAARWLDAPVIRLSP